MQFEITAQKRNDQGTGASRRLRRAGKVPAIVYGAGKDAQAIEVDHNAMFLNLRKEAFHSSVLTLVVDGKKESVLLRDTQVHPYKAQVLHVDFQRVTAGQKLHTKVPLHFVNADIAPGVKLGGGIASHVLNELEVECLPKDLPEFIEADLKELAVGQSLHISDLKLPKGVSAVLHGQDDPVVATIVAPQKAEVDAAAEGGSEEAPAA